VREREARSKEREARSLARSLDELEPPLAALSFNPGPLFPSLTSSLSLFLPKTQKTNQPTGTFTNQIQKHFEEPRLLILTDPRTDHQPIREVRKFFDF